MPFCAKTASVESMWSDAPRGRSHGIGLAPSFAFLGELFGVQCKPCLFTSYPTDVPVLLSIGLGGPATGYVYDRNMLPIGQSLWLKELETYKEFIDRSPSQGYPGRAREARHGALTGGRWRLQQLSLQASRLRAPTSGYSRRRRTARSGDCRGPPAGAVCDVTVRRRFERPSHGQALVRRQARGVPAGCRPS